MERQYPVRKVIREWFSRDPEGAEAFVMSMDRYEPAKYDAACGLPFSSAKKMFAGMDDEIVDKLLVKRLEARFIDPSIEIPFGEIAEEYGERWLRRPPSIFSMSQHLDVDMKNYHDAFRSVCEWLSGAKIDDDTVFSWYEVAVEHIDLEKHSDIDSAKLYFDSARVLFPKMKKYVHASNLLFDACPKAFANELRAGIEAEKLRDKHATTESSATNNRIAV